ncbi:putative endonuclease containing a URI domain [Thiovulum sp. ES]|nr:putative endonuclease containing a URI domain [Thiovulum sp. ES]
MIYIGATNNLFRRIEEHKNRINPTSFTAKNHLDKLIYFEYFENIDDAFKREKQLKNWHRDWKFNLIKEKNPNFDEINLNDLF